MHDMEEKMIVKRPKFLDLTKIKLPLAGVASILHRVSGAGMFLCLPVLVWVFHQSLESAGSYERLMDWATHPVAKIIWTGLLWAFFHHLLMGIRILLIDVHVGIEKSRATQSAKLVLFISLLLTLFFALHLWGVL